MDNNPGIVYNRVADSTPVTLNGGTFSFLGNPGGLVPGQCDETVGKLILGPGVSTVTVSHGSNPNYSSCLTFGPVNDPNWADLFSADADERQHGELHGYDPRPGRPGRRL